MSKQPVTIRTAYIGVIGAVGAAIIFAVYTFGWFDSALPQPAQRLGEEFTLALGQEAEVESEGLTMSFDSVLEDSRCPGGTIVCAWQGNAKISLHLLKTSVGEGFIELNTAYGYGRDPKENGDYPAISTYLGYKVRLVELSSKYEARLLVTSVR